jgi:hypothetical protein
LGVPVQPPLTQLSEPVNTQRFPSEHDVPSVAGGFEHWPVVGLQAPATWHWSDALHVTALAAAHTPAWHVVSVLQALPSLHGVPSVAAGLEHWPLLGSHVPARWHWSAPVQVMGFDPVHAPARQTSVCVQALASLQVAPFGSAGLLHAPVDGLQTPGAWHWSAAEQVT